MSSPTLQDDPKELNNTDVWLSCGFDRPPSRDPVDRFLTDLEHVIDEGFDVTHSIDSTDVRTMPAGQDASKCYDQTAEGNSSIISVGSSSRRIYT
ncbi:Transposase, IS5 family [Natrarchaeobaculum sulfurireducens]|uniref:Transposase, IS5 family n=1 Tax=Natrarchaeobaculum sulfurireducens TaxID=2044521 RepID=A0A346PLF5_9EURY|nr:Transposase, IS5 family [Natrarchaeobaculum sulfurireducens]AXR80350.1 Transposase, IS5 family [Natrarchaeobaculum sulfurireducens]